MVKNPPADAGEAREAGSSSASGRSLEMATHSSFLPGESYGQERGGLVYRVAKSCTQLSTQMQTEQRNKGQDGAYASFLLPPNIPDLTPRGSW